VPFYFGMRISWLEELRATRLLFKVLAISQVASTSGFRVFEIADLIKVEAGRTFQTHLASNINGLTLMFFKITKN
jgi:hypothetical protein